MTKKTPTPAKTKAKPCQADGPASDSARELSRMEKTAAARAKGMPGRERNRRICIRQGKQEMARIESDIRDYEKLAAALARDLETLRFQRAIVKGALEILSDV